ncbi:hypothetical protein HDU98_009750, partial [Podochytrium sp. JEL0797]
MFAIGPPRNTSATELEVAASLVEFHSHHNHRDEDQATDSADSGAFVTPPPPPPQVMAATGQKILEYLGPGALLTMLLSTEVIPWTAVKAVSCKNCHTKKLRCDKLRPACSSCVKRSTGCEYVSTPTSLQSSSSSDKEKSSIPTGDRNISEMASLTSTARSSSNNSISSSSGNQTSFGISSLLLPPLLTGAPPKLDLNLTSPIQNIQRLQQQMLLLASGTAEDHPAITPTSASLQPQHPDLKRKRQKSETPPPQSETNTPTSTKLIKQSSATLTNLADQVIARLQQTPSSSSSSDPTFTRLTCAKLWIIDPSTHEKIYFCPVCKKDYKTANGLKYHLGQHPSSDLPAGYYWHKPSTNGNSSNPGDPDESDNNASTPGPSYSCKVLGCHNEYSSSGGLRYHLLHAHTTSSDDTLPQITEEESPDPGTQGDESDSPSSSDSDHEDASGEHSSSTPSHHPSTSPLDHLLHVATISSETLHLSTKFKNPKHARHAAKVATTLSTSAPGTTLADLVIARLPTLKPGVTKRLRCGNLWILDPTSAEKLYFCPICKRCYPTANGIKYHLSNSHKDQSEFPEGYFWDKKGRNEVASERNIALPYACMIGACKNRYSRPAGLNCHITRMHGRRDSIGEGDA